MTLKQTMRTWGVVLLLGCSGSGQIITQDAADSTGQKDDLVTDVAVVDRGSPDEAGGPDLALMDLSVPDRWVGCQPGTGCFGEPCQGPEDCQSGLCLDHMGDSVCSDFCIEECPEGFQCQQITGTGSDVAFACVSPFSHLCRPCQDDSGCASAEGLETSCVEYLGEGWFCGADCQEHGDCPQGFSCLEATSITGQVSLQCIAQAGICECSDKAMDLGLATLCHVTNESGTCYGERGCSQSGLSDCDAAIPKEDTCNGLDDDCDSEVDEGTCDDGNGCTADGCAGVDGCVNTPLDQGTCDDGNPCTVTDHCSGGECVGTVVVCDDGNPCTDDVCDGESGCQFPLNTTPCDDGDPCTIADFCVDGTCSGTHVGSCDDGNPCTTDACDPNLGCVHTPKTGSCNDNNACTTGESCVEGACKPAGFLNCNDGKVCTDDFCDPQQGCVNEANAAPCDDGSICTLNDTCSDGECVGGKAMNCDDSNPCTTDSCLPLVGCAHTKNSDPCDDSDPCTTGDTCSGGICIGVSQINCDDANPCTNDFCTPMIGCDHSSNTASCDDGNVCTVGDKCVAGKCQAGGPMACNDGNPCTDDACTAGAGCTFAANNAACDDKNSCTIDDACTDGVCQGSGSLDCDDGNACTVDICLPQGGCSHKPATGACSDGDPCTLDDVCVQGQCQPGEPQNCDDGNACTQDSCGDKGCLYQPLTDTACDDNNECTPMSSCKAGVCKGAGTLKCDDDNVCTTDYCDPSSGCIHALNTAPCDDGDVCTLKDACSLGECVGSQVLSCNDNNSCTDDACESGVGCQFIPNAGDCDDGQLCTIGDHCEAGACVAGGFLDCDDENLCTDDYCDIKLGCVNIDNVGACDDGNACTENDTCADGTCDGAPVDCGDNNSCTDDSCDPDTGCLNEANTAACNDGNACTQNDVCSDKSCGGEAVVCNDNEICTDDSCDPDSGCVFDIVVPCCGNGQVDAGEQCDDGNHQSDDGCSDACVSEKFIFQLTQTIDGKTVTCSSTDQNGSYTQCSNLKVDGLYFPNGIDCGPVWSGTNSSYSDTKGFCASLTGKSNIQVYYNCASSITRATWYNHVWGTVGDNGYTQHVRCYY